MSPAEIEDILHRHPSIRQAAVVGSTDERLVEVVALFVILKEGHQESPESIAAWCGARMAGFKVPRRVWVVDDFEYDRDDCKREGAAEGAGSTCTEPHEAAHRSMKIETSVTRLCGIELSIAQAGMSWASSCSELPLAVAKAGGLGVIGAGPMRVPDLARVLDEMRTGTDRPYAVNLPLYRKGADEVLDLLAEDVAFRSSSRRREGLADISIASRQSVPSASTSWLVKSMRTRRRNRESTDWLSSELKRRTPSTGTCLDACRREVCRPRRRTRSADHSLRRIC